VRVVVATMWTLACVACPVTAPVVGKSCKNDAACAGDGVHHCELALANPICLPGPPGVAAPKDRAPVGTSTLIVALTNSTPNGTLTFVDPEGDQPTIEGSPDAASPGVVAFHGGTALLTITDVHQGSYELVAGAAPFVETQPVLVSDGTNTAAVPVVLAVVDASSSSVSSGGDWSSGAAWSTGAPPIATSTAFVDGAVHLSGPAAQAAQLFATARSSLAIEPDGVVTNGAAPAFFVAGSVSGDGKLGVAAGTLLAGNAPAFSLALGAEVVGALAARSIGHASGGELVVDEGASLVVSEAADLPTLTLASSAVVEVDGPLTAQELDLVTSPDGDRERTVVVRSDASIPVIRPGSWRLIVDGKNAPQTLRFHGGLDAVEIRPDADASFAGVTHMNDALLEGGIAVDGDVVVDTLHIRRIPRAIAGSKTIHAAVCDVPGDVDVALPSYIACGAKR
jgi:hypothetical protein